MGVTVSVADSHGLDMREIDFSSLLYADSYSRSSSIFSAHTGNWTDQFRGSGFKYDGNGYPTAGTVTSYAILSGGSRMVLISGFSIAAAKITSAAKTGSLSDDLAIIRDALAGNDNLNGGESPTTFGDMQATTSFPAASIRTTSSATMVTTRFRATMDGTTSMVATAMTR